ncbi:cytochrome b5-like heme/steroid binding domain-containing protein [Mycena olivaceomarginata]|uniref:Cytochrome b5-like heme/steroid binding domain-containing protein n=1 Tax=Mycena albidolilacea TaxID=1033008 RepID=A0AAD7AVN5_9AGAR|nr:cytochrome b5-like heme/steroid binding domain-containing protein [Mycena albidolilacea]KAJ7887546.1 cytochrome b5-like heme/steroid binding domain-containing protein [Mycena olivaceomarginata]
MSAPKVVTLAELRANNTKDKLYILIHEKVYDVTKFLDEHPGGDEVILAESGQDATEAFEDVGHSDEARELLPGMLVGEFEKNSELKLKSGAAAAQANRVTAAAVEQGSNLMYWAPLGLLAAWFGYRFYSTGAPY